MEINERLEKALGELSSVKGVDLLSTKADEAMNTTNTGVLVNETVWTLKVDENELVNVSALYGNIIDMPTDKYVVPMAGQKPTFYKVLENGDVPWTAGKTSKQAFSKVELNAERIQATIYVSKDLVENTRFNLVNFINTATKEAFAEAQDELLLNGDKTITATWNVNSDDAAPAWDELFLIADGLRKQAIVDGNVIDAGVLELADFRALRSKLGKKGLKVNKLKYLAGYETYFEILGLSPVETVEKFGAAATVVNGVLSKIDWIDLVPVAIEKTDVDGKINTVDTASNTKGTILCVHNDGVLRGIFDNIAFYNSFIAKTQQYEIVASASIAQTIMSGYVAMAKNITLS